ncbi:MULTISPECIES: NAD(P)H:quinone oxidoreductase [unclassified Acinetobacter]|uniref:NAD(P)H:quinone oxidoreductase n=1 Tax=unclassified Acinetobacter TaxID=196816 RepID=UPI0035BA7CEB
MATDYILVLYYSKTGHTKEMAQYIAQGIQQMGLSVKLRTVPEVFPEVQTAVPSIPEQGDLYCSVTDLQNCAGLVLGSPTRFGNMAAPLKYFLEQTTGLWLSGALQGKPASVFTSSGAMHGGQESTLLSMYLPLLHHGMLLMGLPNSESALSHTKTGGTPYGVSHVSGARHDLPISDDEKSLCIAQGERMAKLVLQLKK